MKIEFTSSADSTGSRSPKQVFRKWVLIGGVIGALLVMLIGGLFLSALMVAGGFVGAAFGAVFGAFRAAVVAVSGR